MNPPREIEEFGRKAIPILKQYGLIKTSHTLLYVFTALVIGIMVCGTIFYSSQQGYFKSDINQDVDLESQINNSYEITTENEYEHRIDLENNVTVYVNNFVECSDG